MAMAGVVWAEHDAARRNLDFGENRAGDRTRVYVTGMGGNASDGPDFFLFGREIGSEIFAQSRSIRGIEAARDGRFPHDSHCDLLKCASNCRHHLKGHETKRRSAPALKPPRARSAEFALYP